MKKIGLIILMTVISLRLFAPSMNIDWIQIINEFKIQKEKQQMLTLALEIKSTETWHDSLNYKYGNPYKKVNRIGAMGAYQFMPKTLRGLGYKGTFRQFLNNPELQTEYMLKLMYYNKSILSRKSYTYKVTPINFIGKKIKGIEITLSGLLAASHLGGAGGVQRFIATNYNATDGNMTIKCYLKKFKGII
jgi:hypothetical protein